ncbi:MAG: hypothetical protein RSC93_02275 [Erysipelotrichaceae bacterium]
MKTFSQHRKDFENHIEEWYDTEIEWDEKRNCYKEFVVHSMFQIWMHHVDPKYDSVLFEKLLKHIDSMKPLDSEFSRILSENTLDLF